MVMAMTLPAAAIFENLTRMREDSKLRENRGPYSHFQCLEQSRNALIHFPSGEMT